MRKDFAAAFTRPAISDAGFVALLDALHRLMIDRMHYKPPFWQQCDWKKVRRRAWKQRRSSGLHQ